MARRGLAVYAGVAEEIRALHPARRTKIRAVVDALRDDPYLGAELREELAGLWRYPIGRLRLVYRFDERVLEVLAVGPRAAIYEEVAQRVRGRTRHRLDSRPEAGQ